MPYAIVEFGTDLVIPVGRSVAPIPSNGLTMAFTAGMAGTTIPWTSRPKAVVFIFDPDPAPTQGQIWPRGIK